MFLFISVTTELKLILITFFLGVCVVGVMEIVKAMQELDVTLNVETLSNYIIPVFPSTDAAQTALKVAQKSVVCVCV